MPDITVTTSAGDRFSAYFARSPSEPAPGIVLIQEIFGVNPVMRETADEYAKEGFLVVCPDLFWRIEPGVQLTDRSEEEWQKAFALYNRFDAATGIEDLLATIDHTRGAPACTGRVGAVGYCLGGKLAYLMATRSTADCSVAYYGVGIDGLLEEADNIRKPLLMHVAEEDQFVPKEAQERIKGRLAPLEFVVINSYTGLNHAFCRKGGANYNAEAAEIANRRTLVFLHTHLD